MLILQCILMVFIFCSLFAMKADIPEIYACEKSRTMLEITHDVFQANRADDKINLICKASSDLDIPADIHER